jgi:hypothetical protein
MFLRPEGLCSTYKGGGAQLLVEHVSFLGLHVQNWMQIALGMIAVYAPFSWRIEKRT